MNLPCQPVDIHVGRYYCEFLQNFSSIRDFTKNLQTSKFVFWPFHLAKIKKWSDFHENRTLRSTFYLELVCTTPDWSDPYRLPKPVSKFWLWEFFEPKRLQQFFFFLYIMCLLGPSVDSESAIEPCQLLLFFMNFSVKISVSIFFQSS